MAAGGPAVVNPVRTGDLAILVMPTAFRRPRLPRHFGEGKHEPVARIVDLPIDWPFKNNSTAGAVADHIHGLHGLAPDVTPDKSSGRGCGCRAFRSA